MNSKNSVSAAEKSAEEILKMISDKLNEIGEPPFKTTPTEKEDNRNALSNEAGKTIICRTCLEPIKHGDICIASPCCGALSHLECLGKIAEAHRTMMFHGCPRCMTEFTPEFEKSIKKTCSSYKQIFEE